MLARKGTEYTLPKAPVRNIAKSVGGLRMSDDAVIAIKKAAEAYIAKLTADAHKLTQHAKRVTINEEDVKMALKG